MKWKHLAHNNKSGFEMESSCSKLAVRFMKWIHLTQNKRVESLL